VNRSGHKLLAGAGFARQQHTDWVVQDLADQPIDHAHARTVTDQPVPAGAGARRGDLRRDRLRCAAQSIEQRGLAEAETAKVGQGCGCAGEVLAGGTGRHHQPDGMTFRILQRQAQQAAPRARRLGEEACLMQTGVQLGNAQLAVLAEAVLQQLFVPIVAGQACCLVPPRAFEPFGRQGQARMGRIQQVKLGEGAASQLRRHLHHPVQPTARIGRPGQLGESIQ